MLKNLIILPDGTELSSGVGQTNNIQSVTLTECVNSGDELTPGSACAAMVEVTIQTPMGNLALNAGDEITLYKIDDNGDRHKAGIYTLEKPTRTSANILKLTGYDNVVKLDKDLTAWLNSLTGWPYTVWTFASMVCNACDLKLATETLPNGGYLVQQITRTATGRQLMQWIGEVCCRFCRANADGKIELAWYTPSGVSITPTGDRYFFQRGLTYEDYQVAPIDAVQIRLADSEDGALWPEVEDGANSYIISGNPILSSVTESGLDTKTVLNTLKWQLYGTYTPCTVSIPAALDIHAGNTVQITDANGVTITTYVMTKTQKGQRDTLESTGSPRRDSTTALNNKTDREKTAAAETYADNAAKQAVSAQTQLDIFNKLTNNGELQGLYLQDGKLYINAEFVQIVNLIADSIVSGIIKSVDGTVRFDLDKSLITTQETLGGSPVRTVFSGSGINTRVQDATSGEWGEIFNVAVVLVNGEYKISITDGRVNSRLSGLSINGMGGLNLSSSYGDVVISGKTVSWKDNGDGTYTLVGS